MLHFVKKNTGLSRKLKSKRHHKKQSTGICKCKVYPFSADNLSYLEGSDGGSLWHSFN